jgi:16S rRNA (cytosine967-C5)-methyltransferase
VKVAVATDPEAQGPFDAVLVDAPCSNTGVLRRRLEARWRLQPPELERCQRQQLELLADAARRVRPGGRLVYSTCSVEPEENGGVVQAFLAAHPGYRLTRSRSLDPARDGVDGAYVACLAAPA